MTRRRARDDPYGTVELFPATAGGSSVEKPRKATAKSVRQGKCPQCLAQRTGLVPVGEHLVWRAHTYRTWSGASLPCRAAGVAVCVAPERDPLNPSDPARCPHDRR